MNEYERKAFEAKRDLAMDYLAWALSAEEEQVDIETMESEEGDYLAIRVTQGDTYHYIILTDIEGKTIKELIYLIVASLKEEEQKEGCPF